jgi:hypothetical protein
VRRVCSDQPVCAHQPSHSAAGDTVAGAAQLAVDAWHAVGRTRSHRLPPPVRGSRRNHRRSAPTRDRNDSDTARATDRPTRRRRPVTQRARVLAVVASGVGPAPTCPTDCFDNRCHPMRASRTTPLSGHHDAGHRLEHEPRSQRNLSSLRSSSERSPISPASPIPTAEDACRVQLAAATSLHP